jgi:chromatin remodeling complex protein RSC6
MPTGKGTKTTASKAVKSTKATKTTKAAAAPAPAPVAEAAAAPAPEVTPEDEGWSAADDLDTLIAEVTALKAATTTVLSNLKEFSKKNARKHKQLTKAVAKKTKSSSGPRKPSGFTKPTPITPELATFIGKPAGTEMARTDVTKEINAYVRAHNLQDKENGRKIIPDKKLSALLKVGKDDELTYFNLQKYLSPHFVKAQASA